MRRMQIAMGKRDVGSDAPTKDSLIYYIGNAGTSDIVLFCNYSEPRKIAFCECLHSNRKAILYGEVTT